MIKKQILDLHMGKDYIYQNIKKKENIHCQQENFYNLNLE